MLDVVLLRARGLDPGVKLFYTYASRLGFFTCLPCLALSSNVYSILLYLAPQFLVDLSLHFPLESPSKRLLIQALG